MYEIEGRIRSYKDTPWCSNPKAYQNIVYEDDNVIIFKDRFPVTEGHLLYVPKKVTQQLDITICFEYAYKRGVRGICEHEWDAFNVGINNGEAAGQSVMWPHVHLIPRREGDTPNPRGGVRHVIPLKGDYNDVSEKEELAQIAEASHRTVEELFSPVAKINKMCTEVYTNDKPKFDW